MPARTAPLRTCHHGDVAGDDVSVTSSVALECHSRLILEELSAMVDEEGSDYSSSDSEDSDEEDVDDRRARRQTNANDPILLNSEVDIAAGLSYKHGCADSELSLDDVLRDSSVPLVRRRDARVVDSAVRSGSQMFRSRSCAAAADMGFNRTGSILGRVIKSASGRVLHNPRASSDRVGGAGGANRGGAVVVMGRNATFVAPGHAAVPSRGGHHHRRHPNHHGHGHHHHHHGRCNGHQDRAATGTGTSASGEIADAAPADCPSCTARNAGHDLLVDFAPRGGGAGGGRSPTAAVTGPRAGQENGGGNKPSNNIFRDALDSANFVKLMGGAAAPAPLRSTPQEEAANASASSLEGRFQESLTLDNCPTIQE